MKVRSIVPVSGETPFTACPFDAPPPFTDSEWQPENTAVEPHIAVDPDDADNVAVAWMQDFTQGVVVAYTRDAGRTWAQSIPPKLGKCSGSDGTTFDPRLSFGADGTLYLSTMRNLVLNPARTTPDNEVAVSVSPDGGRTWRDPVTVQPRDGYNDFPYVAADPTDRRRVYVTFSKNAEPVNNTLLTMFASSTDGGATFSKPRLLYRATDVIGYYGNGRLAVQPDGRLALVLWIYDALNFFDESLGTTSRIRVLTSADHGQTFSQPVEVGRQTKAGAAPDPESGDGFGAGNPNLAPAADGGWLVTWGDYENGRSRIMIARGRKDGSWESPHEAIGWAPRQTFFANGAVAPDGSIGLMWYDSRADRPNDGKFLVDAFFAVSRDGGRSFEELHVAGPMDLRAAYADARQFTGGVTRFLGDYTGMAASRNGFVGALPFTAPVGRSGKSQVFVADVREAAKKPRSQKAKKKSRRKKRRHRR